MHAVIDTGGPRVMRCAERADRRIIPRASPILYLPSRPPISSPSYSIQRGRSCFVVDALARCTNDDIAPLPEPSIDVEIGIVPGNDERDGFLPDERSPPVSTTSSNDLGRLVANRERRDRARDRKRYDALQRRANRPSSEIHRRRGDFSSAERDVTRLNDETVRECSRLSSADRPPMRDDTIDRRKRIPTIHLEKESATSARHLTSDLRDDEPDERGGGGEGGEGGEGGGVGGEGERSLDIIMRLFGGCCIEQQQESGRMCREVGRKTARSAAISSQRVSNGVEYEWPCECECFSSVSGEESGSSTARTRRTTSESEITTRERRKGGRHRSSSIRQKSRSCVQLAILLFLLAFGHGSLSKSNFLTFGGKSVGIGAGLGVLTIGTIVGSVTAVPVDLDAGARAERSANLSHITGASRKIQMYIKNRHLQILPDGTVNGSNDYTSEYTIFQRTSVSRGQLKIQGVATCLYLCMDSCGLLYGSREYTDDCVFNETLEQHNYNTYSSVRWSTPKKSLYLGLNRRGQPRRVQAKGHNLGRLSAYARVLTQVASPERVEALQARMLGAHHNLRHRHNSHHHRNIQNHRSQQEQQQQQPQTVCPSLPPQEKDGRDKFRCRKRKKRKKRKRQCNEGEKPGPHCEFVEERLVPNHKGGNGGKSTGASEAAVAPHSKRSCEGAASEELCRKQALDAPAKKRKSRIEVARTGVGTRQQKQSRKKEPKMKKGTDDERQPVNGGGGGGGKRPPGASKQKTSSMGARKKINGRVSRTTVPANPSIGKMTLPSSWYPGASTSPRSTEVARNAAVTSETSKARHASRNEKSVAEPRLGAPKSSTTIETGTESNSEEISSVPYLTSDTSLETSEEAKLDDSSMQLEDETTIPSVEYSTFMTTMDTTPPERTEDYTRATTQSSLAASDELDHDREDVTIDGLTSLETTRHFGRENRPSLARLAM